MEGALAFRMALTTSVERLESVTWYPIGVKPTASKYWAEGGELHTAPEIEGCSWSESPMESLSEKILGKQDLAKTRPAKTEPLASGKLCPGEPSIEHPGAERSGKMCTEAIATTSAPWHPALTKLEM